MTNGPNAARVRDIMDIHGCGMYEARKIAEKQDFYSLLSEAKRELEEERNVGVSSTLYELVEMLGKRVFGND